MKDTTPSCFVPVVRSIIFEAWFITAVASQDASASSALFTAILLSRAAGLAPLSLLVTDIKTQILHGFSFRSEQFIALAINTASL